MGYVIKLPRGVLSRCPLARYEYVPTEKGLALFPVIAALIHWGDTWSVMQNSPS